jgi:hypothetical protein
MLPFRARQVCRTEAVLWVRLRAAAVVAAPRIVRSLFLLSCAVQVLALQFTHLANYFLDGAQPV